MSRYQTDLKFSASNTSTMPTSVTIPDGYGYTVLIALGLIPILGIGQGSVVTTLRKPANVPYPNAYATPEQVKSSREAYKFNCAQRAHGNLLENMPMAVASLLFAGLFYPQATPILGLVWVVSRAFYAYGYITSEQPNGKGRYYGGLGGFFWAAQLGLIGLSVSAALKML